MVRGARYAYAALTWAFVAAILLQVFFIGLGLFVKPQSFDLHVNFGWLLHLGSLSIPVAAALASAGRTRILLSAGLVIVFFIVPVLAAVRADAPWAAAFHPVGALLGFWLATLLARGAPSLLRSTDTEMTTTRIEWLVVVIVVLVMILLSFGGPNS
jgi:nicotinamide riboside transporter PnuC